jgi:hypothetical protein
MGKHLYTYPTVVELQRGPRQVDHRLPIGRVSRSANAPSSAHPRDAVTRPVLSSSSWIR